MFAVRFGIPQPLRRDDVVPAPTPPAQLHQQQPQQHQPRRQQQHAPAVDAAVQMRDNEDDDTIFGVRSGRLFLLYFFGAFVLVRVWMLVVDANNDVYTGLAIAAMAIGLMAYCRWRRLYYEDLHALAQHDAELRARELAPEAMEEFVALQDAIRRAHGSRNNNLAMVVPDASDPQGHLALLLIAGLPSLVYAERRPTSPRSALASSSNLVGLERVAPVTDCSGGGDDVGVGVGAGGDDCQASRSTDTTSSHGGPGRTSINIGSGGGGGSGDDDVESALVLAGGGSPSAQPTPRLRPKPPSERERERDTLCMVCLADFVPGDVITYLPCACSHRYHRTCIALWLSRKTKCPLCCTELLGTGGGGTTAVGGTTTGGGGGNGAPPAPAPSQPEPMRARVVAVAGAASAAAPALAAAADEGTVAGRPP
jgi:hypothetical protein